MCEAEDGFGRVGGLCVCGQKLKQEFRSRAERGGAVMLKAKVDTKSVKHDRDGSSFSCDDGSNIHARMIVDCSGFNWALVEKEGKDEPGVQVSWE